MERDPGTRAHDCRRVEDRLAELVEPDDSAPPSSAEEREVLLAEARACESCRDLLRTYEATVGLLRSLPQSPAPRDFLSWVDKDLEGAARGPRRTLWRDPRLRLIAAAAVIFAAGVLAWRLYVGAPGTEFGPGDLAQRHAPEEEALELAAGEPEPARDRDTRAAVLPPEPGRAEPLVRVTREEEGGVLVAMRFDVSLPHERAAEVDAFRRQMTGVLPEEKLGAWSFKEAPEALRSARGSQPVRDEAAEAIPASFVLDVPEAEVEVLRRALETFARGGAPPSAAAGARPAVVAVEPPPAVPREEGQKAQPRARFRAGVRAPEPVRPSARPGEPERRLAKELPASDAGKDLAERDGVEVEAAAEAAAEADADAARAPGAPKAPAAAEEEQGGGAFLGREAPSSGRVRVEIRFRLAGDP